MIKDAVSSCSGLCKLLKDYSPGTHYVSLQRLNTHCCSCPSWHFCILWTLPRMRNAVLAWEQAETNELRFRWDGAVARAKKKLMNYRTVQCSVWRCDTGVFFFFKDTDAGSSKRWLTITSGKIIVESSRKEDTSAGSVVYFSDAGFSFMTNDPLEERASFTKARLLIVRRIYHHTTLKGSWWKECESFVYLNVDNFMNFWDALKWDAAGRNHKEHVFS